ncbi:MAG: bifunctional hydroxymethylpyrimidine kinase/phosphomethylpyrimidine kinase [Lentisphaerae bacterium]|nr:bifunctional hydroxymethylpyrimidine kinase/phosphomethylpyrimidine kinase [Lentisphaerota bacterium]
MKAKPDNAAVKLVVVGSIGLDTVTTSATTRRNVLGGSVSYACAAASFFTRPGLVGVVGRDFPTRYRAALRSRRVDLRGLESAAGRTFRWSCAYEPNLKERETLSTALNVLADFAPELPTAYRHSPCLFLANIAPEVQLKVLSQMCALRFVAADTMDLWIRATRPALLKVIRQVDLFLINDAEARALTGEEHLVPAARHLLKLGPRYVIIKKGEHGSMLFSRQGVVLSPAYPVDLVRDPTGAGDAFAGALLGVLARAGSITSALVRRAMLYGAITASFTVEAFSLEKLLAIRRADIEARARQFRRMIRC